ncbi:uncharacterized protein LOC122383017 [Amphibalanus amphitrite]|nr:uncharacterized protein LOC122383017 [Amphibalanus amphitrite]XP_043224997.1 uncharacterized protein LOC122383017 [Amphibalanus amphitrite]
MGRAVPPPFWLLLCASLLPDTLLNGSPFVTGEPRAVSPVSWRQLLVDLGSLPVDGRPPFYNRDSRMYSRHLRLMGSEFLGKRSGPGRHTHHGSRGRRKRSLGSEFLGKRSADAQFLLQRAPTAELLDKRMAGSEFLGKRVPGSEFLGKRVPEYVDDPVPNAEGIDKEMADWNESEKRAPGTEFLGKRMPGSEFLGKRFAGSEFLGKRKLGSEFLGKRRLDEDSSQFRMSRYPETEEGQSNDSEYPARQTSEDHERSKWARFYHHKSILGKRQGSRNWWGHLQQYERYS